MTSWVLNDVTAKMAIGDVLALAAGSGIEIHDEAGNVVATIIVKAESQLAADSLIDQAEAEIDELRRRRAADRSRDVTTRQLLAKAGERERN